MRFFSPRPWFFAALATVGWGWFLSSSTAIAADRIRLASYNVENYMVQGTDRREAKNAASMEKVAQVLKAVNADIIALQEIGGAPALEHLIQRLSALGLRYAHWEHVQGWDTNIQVALLSRHPIVARRPHTRDTFLLSGRRFRVSRGILEVEIQVSPRYRLTVFNAHLKSRREIANADQEEMRVAEARILREKIEARLKADPRANLVVLGDLNDTKDSLAVRTLLGRGRNRLVDTRPSERNGDTGYSPDPRWQPRTVSWTHYFGREDTYGRIDYALLHENTAREWVRDETYLPVIPDWGLASDHRPLVVTLEAVDR